MTDYRSPATTTNHYTTGDPTIVNTSNVTNASGNVATLGHPANGVVINDGLHGHTTTTTAHHVAAPVTTHTVPVTKQTTTTTTTATKPMAAQPVHTLPSGANGDGLMVNSNLGGPLGGSVVLGGQCECLRNGGVCKHGAGMCSCRGCTTAATSINPGINIGVSTHQYTAPVGTSGIGGGVADPGTGMAGVIAPTNPIGQPVNSAVQNCDCVRNKGVCNCKPGHCDCTNCTAHRKSLAATNAAAQPHTTTHTHTTHGTATVPSDYVAGKPVTTSTTTTSNRVL